MDAFHFQDLVVSYLILCCWSVVCCPCVIIFMRKFMCCTITLSDRNDHTTVTAPLPVCRSVVKHCRARLVLWWGTTLESLVLFFLIFGLFLQLLRYEMINSLPTTHDLFWK